jgi:serine/threonine-protein kinase RsbW
MTSLQLKIKSQTEKLHNVREFVSDAARKAGFDDESTSKIALAVDEACTNIIKHAYQYAPDKEIEIGITQSNGRFEIIITHQGKLFDPNTVKSPDMKEYLTHYRQGGLGMHLMRLLMDAVEYKVIAAEKCEVHLMKKLPATLH